MVNSTLMPMVDDPSSRQPPNSPHQETNFPEGHTIEAKTKGFRLSPLRPQTQSGENCMQASADLSNSAMPKPLREAGFMPMGTLFSIALLSSPAYTHRAFCI
jgi:hypothetical protein